MSKVFAVIGANFGDEGKGLLTDYLCAGHPRSLVVRFNGGAQAGHTVVVPKGRRHVFHHFGSGTFAGAETYLSQFFIANPILWAREVEELYGRPPVTFLHPDALLTTPWDMMLNQWSERRMGDARHGTCGVGINETVLRSRTPYRTTAADLKDLRSLHFKLRELRGEYLGVRAQELDVCVPENAYSLAVMENFLMECARMASIVGMPDFVQYPTVVFEGAQGLLLDERHEYYPYVTWGRTGLDNVKAIVEEQNLNDELEAIYVSRTYLTRHGLGPFPTEDSDYYYPDETNTYNEYQGKLRYGRLNVPELIDRATADAVKMDLKPTFAVTHMDQLSVDPSELPGDHVVYQCYGPTRNHVCRRT